MTWLTKIRMIRVVIPMIKKILTGVAIAMLVVGIGLVAFPPISNFIGTQISNGEADGFDTRVEEAEDGSFEQAVKDGKVDEEGYKIDRDGKRTSKQPVVFKADLDRLFNDSVAYNKKLETNQYEMLRNDTYSQAAVNLEDYGITDGIYGYVTAETINMRLPIYLGANSSNMSERYHQHNEHNPHQFPGLHTVIRCGQCMKDCHRKHDIGFQQFHIIYSAFGK